MTIGQVLSPAELKKIRKMTWINFTFTMLQVEIEEICAATSLVSSSKNTWLDTASD
jgi:hypothetical protein